MYSFNGRVRYSECDESSSMTLSALVNYFQDCCTFHSESVGLGMEYWKENQSAWLLSYWHIKIDRLPKLGEEICISTWAYKLSGFRGYRNFTIKDKDDRVIAYANSLWVYMDMAKLKFKKADEDQMRMYTGKPAYPMEKLCRKVEISEEIESKEPFKVQRFYIDSNKHVNNEKYILMATEYLPENSQVESLRVEYKNAAVLGDMIYPRVAIKDNKVTVLLGNAEEKPFAAVEFLVREID